MISSLQCCVQLSGEEDHEEEKEEEKEEEEDEEKQAGRSLNGC